MSERDRPPTGPARARLITVALATVLALLLAAAPPAVAQEGSGTDDPPPSDGAPEGDADSTRGDGAEGLDADELRGLYEELVGEEAELLVQYDLAGARLADLLPQVVAAQRNVESIDAALADAEISLRERQVEAAEAREDRSRARRRVREAESRLRHFAVESYIGEGGDDATAMVIEILEGEDASVARRGYRGSVSDQQRRLIDDLVGARTASTDAARLARGAADAAADDRDSVDRLRDNAVDAAEAVTRLATEAGRERQRQSLLIVEVQSRKVSIEARIISLDRAADAVAALLAASQSRDEGWFPTAVDVRLPVAGGEIGSEFGPRSHPILRITRLHAGVDIAASSGEPVLAAADGVVVSTGPSGGYGNTVLMSHGNSLSTVYAHNTSISVQVGDLVQQGCEIAKAGSTGLSTGPHVHFETRLEGVPVNPRNVLQSGDATYGQLDDDSDGTPNRFDPDPGDPGVTAPDLLGSEALAC